MTVFQLLIYSCVSLNGLDGELVSKMCRWDAREMFQTEASCGVAGTVEMGKPIWGDIYEDRTAAKFKCSPVSIRQ